MSWKLELRRSICVGYDVVLSTEGHRQGQTHLVEPKLLKTLLMKNNINHECKIRHDGVDLGKGCAGERP